LLLLLSTAVKKEISVAYFTVVVEESGNCYQAANNTATVVYTAHTNSCQLSFFINSVKLILCLVSSSGIYI